MDIAHHCMQSKFKLHCKGAILLATPVLVSPGSTSDVEAIT